MPKLINLPKYKTIEIEIIDKINSGKYLANELLPTEHELAEMYACSRVTVRHTLSNLENKGFIRKAHGSGSYVNKTKAIQRTSLLKGFTEEMLELGKNPKSIVHTFNVTKAGNEMSRILEIRPDDQIYYIERTRYADNDPVVFERTFMSVELHPNLTMNHLLSSKYKYSEEKNLLIDFSNQNITPIFPPDYIAKELGISNDQPIIRIINITHLTDGTIFDYTELYFHTDRYQLNIIKKR